MQVSRAPEFFVIGAAKAATTWIAHHLRQRDDVFMPTMEPHYFSREFSRGPEWYAGFFAAARPDQLVGEKSADYLAHPDAPERLARTFPDARLIVQLRNPIERAYSDYCMLFRRGTVGRDIARHLQPDSAPLPRFLEDGLYHRHLSRFLAHFPRERIEIVLYEDIRDKPAEVLSSIEAHLGLGPVSSPVTLERRVNDSEAPLLPVTLRKLLAPAKPLVARWRGAPWLSKLHSHMARPVRYPPLTQELRVHLRDYYGEDVRRLSHLLHRDLAPWLAIEPGPNG